MLEIGGTVDQFNMANLVAFELLARRVQLILDAHAGGGALKFRGDCIEG